MSIEIIQVLIEIPGTDPFIACSFVFINRNENNVSVFITSKILLYTFSEIPSNHLRNVFSRSRLIVQYRSSQDRLSLKALSYIQVHST